MANPWDDPSLANEATRKIKKRTEALRLNPLKPSTPRAEKPKPLSTMADAYSKGDALAKRNKKIAEKVGGWSR